MGDSVRVTVIATGFDKRGARPAAAFAGFSTERERGTSARPPWRRRCPSWTCRATRSRSPRSSAKSMEHPLDKPCPRPAWSQVQPWVGRVAAAQCHPGPDRNRQPDVSPGIPVGDMRFAACARDGWMMAIPSPVPPDVRASSARANRMNALGRNSSETRPLVGDVELRPIACLELQTASRSPTHAAARFPRRWTGHAGVPPVGHDLQRGRRLDIYLPTRIGCLVLESGGDLV
jgi:hypothetical protein